MLLSLSEESNQRLTKGGTPLETPRPKPVGAQYRTHSLRRRLRQAGQPPGIQQEEMKRPQPGIRLRRDSRSGRESPRLLPFPARFSFMCWPYEDGGLAALAPLRGAKAILPRGQRRLGSGREISGGPSRSPPPWPNGAGSANPPRGPMEARTPPRTAGGPGRHPPLDGCRPARGPGGLPGRSLSLSLGRESEARTSGATGVNYLKENPAGKKKESGAQPTAM